MGNHLGKVQQLRLALFCKYKIVFKMNTSAFLKLFLVFMIFATFLVENVSAGPMTMSACYAACAAGCGMT